MSSTIAATSPPPASSLATTPQRTKALDTLLWVLAGLSAAVSVLTPFVTTISPYLFALTMTLTFTLAHGLRRYGWKTLLAFFVITFVISNSLENVSIATGFPFGHYHYTSPGPRVLQVPIFIGPFYFGLGYISWLTASTILDRADERLGTHHRVGRFNLVALPVLAGAIMSMYDLGSDSMASTVNKVWMWHDGGGFFGVPYTNYLGWWFVCYAFFQVFALVLSRAQNRRPRPSHSITPGSLAQPIIVYGALGVLSVSIFMTTTTGTAVDPTNTTWDLHAMTEALMTTNIFTTIVIAALGLFKIARGDLTTPLTLAR